MRSQPKRATTKTRILNLLQAKYQADHERFRKYLPEVAQALDAMLSPRQIPRSPWGLTENEREHRIGSLRDILRALNQGPIPPEEAARGLEHCAALIEDDSLPREVTHDTLVKLLEAAITMSLGSIKKNSTLYVHGDEKAQPVKRISILKGITLNLSWDIRLLSIAISPYTMQERHKFLRLVGMAEDVATDVAEKHDHYLDIARKEAHASP